MTERPARDCGTCGMCCKLPTIEAMEKPYAQWCVHAEAGRGCRIYADRPELCRTFRCVWLTADGVDDDLRPDRCGVVMIARPHARYGRTLTCLVERGNFDRVGRRAVRNFLSRLSGRGFKIFVSDGHTNKERMANGDLVTIPFGRALSSLSAGS